MLEVGLYVIKGLNAEVAEEKARRDAQSFLNGPLQASGFLEHNNVQNFGVLCC